MIPIPILLAIVVAIANSPTNVFQICAWNHGTEAIEAWRSTAARGLRVARRVRDWFATHVTARDLVVWTCLAVAAAVYLHGHGGDVGLAIVATSQLKMLRQRAADIHQEMRALADKVSDESRAMTAAERAKVADLKKRFDANKEQLNVAEEANERERNFGVVDDPDDLVARHAQARNGMVNHNAGASSRGRRWAEMFPSTRQASSPWANDSEFLTVIASGRHDPRLTLQAAVMSGSDGPTGIVVPDSMVGNWLDTSLEGELVRPRAQNWGLTTRTRTVPSWDLADRSGGAIAGLTLTWYAEGATAVPQAAKPRAIKLTANRAAIYAQASNELAADGHDFNAQLQFAMSRAVGYGLDTAFLFGTGAGQPLGVFNSSARIAVNRTFANQILYDDLVAMFARMVPASVTKAIWVAHPSTIPMLTSLSIVVGAGGTAIQVMKANDGSFEILTRPVVFSEHAKPLGTAGDIGLFDFSQYVIGMRREVSIEMSNAPAWLQDSQSYRVTVRVDGQPAEAGPIQPDNNAPTMSSFVTLA